MVNQLIKTIERADGTVGRQITAFLKPYFDLRPQGFFSAHLLIFIKITFYLIILIIPFAILKFLHPFNKALSIILVLLIIAITILGFGIFCGFFQLLYS